MKSDKQRAIIQNLFLQHPNEWVGLPTIMALWISQYNRNIKELRESGMNIINEITNVDGQRRSRYMYVPKVKDDLF